MAVNAFMHKARNRRENISPGMRIHRAVNLSWDKRFWKEESFFSNVIRMILGKREGVFFLGLVFLYRGKKKSKKSKITAS